MKMHYTSIAIVATGFYCLAGALGAASQVVTDHAAAHAYVAPSPSGNDSNDCRSETSPCLKLQAAWERVSGMDGAVTLHLADGIYSAGLDLVGRGDDRVEIAGNTAVPGRVLLNVTGSNAVRVQKAHVTISGMEFRTTRSFAQLVALNDGEINFSNVRFGLGGQHITAAQGGRVRATGNYDVVAGGESHLHAFGGGTIELGKGIVVSLHSVVFLAYFAEAASDGSIVIEPNVSFDGLVSATKFSVRDHGRIDSGGLGISGLPGGWPGVIGDTGEYDSIHGGRS